MVVPTEANERNTSQKKDFIFACGMLTIYAVCLVIFISGSFLWIREDRRVVRSNATATEVFAITQRANATATAVAHVTEQAQYEYVDHFEDNSGRWYEGKESGYYGNYSAYVADGVYVWNISDSKGYTHSDDYYIGNNFRDFDAYIDIKFARDTKLGAACSGLTFRKSTLGWEDGAYLFHICNDSHYGVYYYQIGEWDTITSSRVENVIVQADWNRIEVHATGDHFTFYINNAMVFEMTDTRRKTGRLGIYIEVEDGTPAVLWIDNFGIQRR